MEASNSNQAMCSCWKLLRLSKPAIPTGCLLITALIFSYATSALAIESVHFGFNSTNADLTDAIRLSARTGTNWWSLNTTRLNAENSTPLPYAYHDGYVELIGVSKTPAEAADRWFKLLHGFGDPWTGATPLDVGLPSIILLDEISTSFKDTGQGPALQDALGIYMTNYAGSRDDIIGFASPSLSLTPNNNLYESVIFCANNYLRFFAVELYASHEGFITGYERNQPGVYRGTNDYYLINRYVLPVRRWANAGISAKRLLPNLAVSNYADSNGTTTKPFYKFLNRQFWLLANGWYDTNHSVVDTNIQIALRNGVGSYTWTPGTGTFQLITNDITRDSYFEKYLSWYSVDGHLDPHPDGVDAGENQKPTLNSISNQTVNAGFTLILTNSGSDPDFPPDALTFSLDPGAPSGATINPTNGIFTWATPYTSVALTNSITVRVTDNGSPALSDTKTFSVIVQPAPRFSAIAQVGTNILFNWETSSGKTYRIQYKTNLNQATWLTLGPDSTASGPTLSATNGINGNEQRYFRVVRVN